MEYDRKYIQLVYNYEIRYYYFYSRYDKPFQSSKSRKLSLFQIFVFDDLSDLQNS